jgi:hypothetical protein
MDLGKHKRWGQSVRHDNLAANFLDQIASGIIAVADKAGAVAGNEFTVHRERCGGIYQPQ